jgi:hypothetical protein
MRRKAGGFWGRKIAEAELLGCIRNPRTRAEAVLDGLFSQGVVLVESDGDREVYQAASEAINDYASREIQFIPVGGTGGFAEPCRFYQHLEIPVAIIADLDAIADTDKMIACIKILRGEKGDTSALLDSFRTLAQKLKELPPPITEEEFKNALKQLSERDLDWKNRDDNSVRNELSYLTGKIRRIQRLKEGGLEAYGDYPDIKIHLESLIQSSKECGLFFVPRGELEDWVPHLMSDHGRHKNKIERAAIAASRIREAPIKNGDVWEFIQSVFDYLKIRLER